MTPTPPHPATPPPPPASPPLRQISASLQRKVAEVSVASPDPALSELAGRQHGIVTTAQLLDLGFSDGAIQVRIRRGMLHRVHQGVYAVGYAPRTPEAHWLAAVLACGPGAALSHCSAGALWVVRASSATVIDVTSPGRRGRTRPEIRVHDALDLDPVADLTEIAGIPVTTVPRTIVDLAAVVAVGSAEYAIHRAESRRMLDLGELRAVLARMPANHRGAAVVRRIVGAPLHEHDAKTRAPSERRFLRICRRFGVPLPLVNRWIALPIASGGLEVDFCWPAQRLVVEIDEPPSHDTHRAARNDPARDRALVAGGWRPMRFPERELDSPAEVAADVLGALAAGGPVPTRAVPPDHCPT